MTNPGETMTLFQSLEQAIDMVMSEIRRQNEKWGQQDHDDERWIVILGEEFGETCQAILHDRFGGPAAGTTAKEASEVAAVAIQMIACSLRRAEPAP